MSLGRRRNFGGAGGGDSSWPGFVDALSSLLLVMIFLLSLFALAQFFLAQALSGRDEALASLRQQVAQLGHLLQLEQKAGESLRATVVQLSSQLNSANQDRDALDSALAEAKAAFLTQSEQQAGLENKLASLEAALKESEAKASGQQGALEAEQRLSARAKSEIAALEANLAILRDQLARLEAALVSSEERDARNQAVIVDMGRRLNRALAGKVEELAGYRSEFFGRLRQVLADRPEIRVEGDRFVFASELLFRSASAEIGAEGREDLQKFAETLIGIAAEIPPDLKWILRVDGHTDRNPIHSSQFENNWELSAARAIAVVQFLTALGVPAEHLAATGFGEFQPLDPQDNRFAYARNRRIEMRLTER